MAFSPRLALFAAACATALTALLAAQSGTAAEAGQGWVASDMSAPVVQVQNDLSWG
ncbi:hypothetical protein [Streptomyces tanashiensis]|jgi:hypothetical protein|uniref:Uncharacterized protein n=1 Tax=Streptomyces tanashiensis TaxID=67367 RepID=A0ABY6QTW9_9ACTN|nr:hypothetical protein [Streptomyces tanashiensis]UZX21155.1 hypothetical protein LDH80_10670 [Streptomyces tanashiensis]GGY49656.1 hypothetical protein GCM10010299_64770 [Streptomyces tanashiensis]